MWSEMLLAHMININIKFAATTVPVHVQYIIISVDSKLRSQEPNTCTLALHHYFSMFHVLFLKLLTISLGC